MPSVVDIRKGNCPACDHHEILERVEHDLYGTGGNSMGVKASTYVAKTYSIGPDQPDLDRPVGVVKAYTCRACGYLQHYVSEPQAIAHSGETNIRLIKGIERKDAYR